MNMNPVHFAATCAIIMLAWALILSIYWRRRFDAVSKVYNDKAIRCEHGVLKYKTCHACSEEFAKECAEEEAAKKIVASGGAGGAGGAGGGGAGGAGGCAIWVVPSTTMPPNTIQNWWTCGAGVTHLYGQACTCHIYGGTYTTSGTTTSSGTFTVTNGSTWVSDDDCNTGGCTVQA